jgi:glucokinase
MTSGLVAGAALGAAHVLGPRGPGPGGAKQSSDLACLALGTGVAAGLMLDGRLRRGFRGGAGEIGHVPYQPAGPLCACGQRGCLELDASGPRSRCAALPRAADRA